MDWSQFSEWLPRIVYVISIASAIAGACKWIVKQFNKRFEAQDKRFEAQDKRFENLETQIFFLAMGKTLKEALRESKK